MRKKIISLCIWCIQSGGV